jgi:chitinase
LNQDFNDFGGAAETSLWRRPVTATQINWNWGSNTNVDFDAASDTLDFGWFQADQFTISEVNGTVVIAIPSNQQTYTLQHTTLHDLHLSNIIAKDASAIGEGQPCSAVRP